METHLIERDSTKLHLDRLRNVIITIRQRCIGHRRRSSRRKGLELGNDFTRGRCGRTERRGRGEKGCGRSGGARWDNGERWIRRRSSVRGGITRLKIFIRKSRTRYLHVQLSALCIEEIRETAPFSVPSPSLQRGSSNYKTPRRCSELPMSLAVSAWRVSTVQYSTISE